MFSLAPAPTPARLVDAELAYLEAKYFAGSREEAVRGHFTMVQSPQKEELISRLVDCDDPATIEWARGVLDARDPNVPFGHPDLEARVAAVLLVRQEGGEYSLTKRLDLGLDLGQSALTVYEWENRLFYLAAAKKYPVGMVSPEVVERWGDGFRVEYTEEKKAELKDLIGLAAKSGGQAAGLLPYDFHYLLRVWMHQGPDTEMLEAFWSDPRDVGRSLALTHPLLIKLCEGCVDPPVREWALGKLREARDSQDEESRQLAGSSIAYLEKNAHDFEVRRFLEQTIIRRPGNYAPNLPRLIFALRYEDPYNSLHSLRRAAIGRVEDNFRELADMAADSAQAYPTDVWVIRDPGPPPTPDPQEPPAPAP